MSYLYQLEGTYAYLQSLDLDDESFKDTLDSIDFQSDLENNIEYFIKLMKNAEADEKMFKDAVASFKEKESKAKDKKEKFKDIILKAMSMSDQKKIQAGLFTVSTRRSEAVEILDESKIPVWLMTEKHTFTPNKTEIKKAIKSGKEVDGVILQERESVVVK